jgi:hypothetical protein
MGYTRFGYIMTVKKDWVEKAKCNGMETDLFFDKYEEDVDLRPAVDSLCATCPVQRECLATGVSRQEWGVWGGVYFEKGKISKEFNSHKNNDSWFNIMSSALMEKYDI